MEFRWFLVASHQSLPPVLATGDEQVLLGNRLTQETQPRVHVLDLLQDVAAAQDFDTLSTVSPTQTETNQFINRCIN